MATLNRYLTIEKDFDIVLTPSIDKEGGWNFLKMAAMGGLEIFTKNRGRGGARNGGGGGKFLKSLYMVGRKVLTPLFHEDPSPPILPTPPFPNFVLPPLPPFLCHIQPPTPLFFLLSCFFGWMGHHATHVKPWYLSTKRVLICVLCN